MKTIWVGLLVVVVCSTVGCESVPGISSLLDDGQADLVAVAGVGFCRPGPTLVVTVRNQGPANAEGSITRVTFAVGGEARLPTPALEGGRLSTLEPFNIPAECFAPNCSIQITVDAENDVDESDEANNATLTTCNAS